MKNTRKSLSLREQRYFRRTSLSESESKNKQKKLLSSNLTEKKQSKLSDKNEKLPKESKKKFSKLKEENENIQFPQGSERFSRRLQLKKINDIEMINNSNGSSIQNSSNQQSKIKKDRSSSKPQKTPEKLKTAETEFHEKTDKNKGNKSKLSQSNKKVEKLSKHIRNTSETKNVLDFKTKKQKFSKFQEAIDKLQEYSLPESIPCREDEKNIIQTFLSEGLINKGSNQILYISGVPGIGKTASFLEVVKNLNSEHLFQFININCMKLKDPENVYLVLLQEITNIKNVSKNTACLILNNLFRTNSLPKNYKSYSQNIDRKTKVILLDELDYLLTKDQTILYNLVEWPHCKFSNMIVAGIANTVDFPEKLQPKISSRIGNRRLTYKPYSSEQIVKIIKDRLSRLTNVFTQNALTFVSKKIASFSSDIRRTLNVCRKAIEIKMEKIRNLNDCDINSQLVDIAEIRESYDELYKTVYVEMLKNLPVIQKLLLIALALETKHQDIGRVYERFFSMLTTKLGQTNTLTKMDILQIFYQMMNVKILEVKTKYTKKLAQKKEEEKSLSALDCNTKDYDINICINIDDISNALKDDELFADLYSVF